MTGQDAAGRALRLYRSPGFRRAYVRGAQAALVGTPLGACPYPPDAGKTWRTAYRLAWQRGWMSEASDVE